MRMSKRYFKGILIDTETGKSSPMNFRYYPTKFEIETIIEVQECDAYTHPDGEIQVLADCLALDCFGGVFELSLQYQPVSEKKKNILLEELTPGAHYMASGPCGIAQGRNECSIMVFDAIYRRLPPDYSEEEIRQVFQHNRQELE